MGAGLSSCCATANGTKEKIVKSKYSQNGATQEDTDSPGCGDAKVANSTEPAEQSCWQETSDAALIGEFKACLKNRTKSVKDAFSRLGAADDDLIDFEEFNSFLTDELDYTDEGQVRRIFEIMDGNRNGSVCWQEFKALKNDALGLDKLNQDENDNTRAESRSGRRKSTAQKSTLKKDTLSQAAFEGSRELLKSRFKSCQEAFDGLGGQGSESIELEDFQRFHMAELDYSKEQLERLFNELDIDKDGALSWIEFKSYIEVAYSDSKSATKKNNRLSGENLSQTKDDNDDRDDEGGKGPKKKMVKRQSSVTSSTTASSKSPQRKEQKKGKDKA